MTMIGEESDFRPSGVPDGSIDFRSGVALEEEGVQTFRLPHLAYMAEKIGRLPIGAFNAMGNMYG